MLLRFALCVLVRLIIYKSKLFYLLNHPNPHSLGANHSKAIKIDKLCSMYVILINTML